MRLARVAPSLAVLLLATPAFAQTPEADVAAAQALFDEGKRLMQENKYAEACPKLQESQRLDPGGGTLLALGLCHEAEGKTASAWADFNLAVSAARRDNRPEREKTAAEHVKALDAKVPRVRVVVKHPPEGLWVKRDGTALGIAQWGTAVPTDPGDHKFEAGAPGKKPWLLTVTVAEGATTDVDVPVLADAPAEPAAVPSAPAPAPSTPPAKAGDASSSLSTAALVVGGVSLLTLGIGTVFALSARAKWNDASGVCPGNKCTNPQAVTEGHDAGRAADFATAFFVIGAASAVACGALFLWAPSSSSSSVRVTPVVGRTNGLALEGRL